MTRRSHDPTDVSRRQAIVSGDLVLVGGGHAHVAVLAEWIENGAPSPASILLTPSTTLRYSGMVPAWIAGHYGRGEGLVDLAALAKRAGARLVLDSCERIDPHSRIISTANGRRLKFDIASVDTGGVGRAMAVLGRDPRLVDIRPIAAFVDRLAPLLSPGAETPSRVLVAGGGAGGVELAFGLRNMRGAGRRPRVTLALGPDGLLPEFSGLVRRTVERELRKQGIEAVEGNAWLRNGVFGVNDCALEPVDLAVAALGSAAPGWPLESGLACDPDGFIAVDRHQRSVSHPQIFAVGDVASRQDRNVPHSGVHAVFAGPVLANNLRAAIAGKEPSHTYKPRWKNLYLLSTGDGSAIASYGPLAARGPWVAKLKDWIDRRWIAKYEKLARGNCTHDA